MSTELRTRENGKLESYESALMLGDVSKLTPEERLSYYAKTCTSLGLNHLTKPFEFITLKGKLVMYATRTCTDQLRKINGVSLTIVAREKVGDMYVVTARAIDKAGRTDESTGVVSLGKLFGDDLANALMKAETKAKRRVTLSICGLGCLDESELETVPGAQRVNIMEQNVVPLPPLDPPAIAIEDRWQAAREEAEAIHLGKAPYRGGSEVNAILAQKDAAAATMSGKPITDKQLWKVFFDLKEKGFEMPRMKKEECLEYVKGIVRELSGDKHLTAASASTAIDMIKAGALPGQGGAEGIEEDELLPVDSYEDAF